MECDKECCGCGAYRRQFGKDDIPKELQDWISWEELESEHPYSRKWFEVFLGAIQSAANDQIDWLSTEYAAEFGPQDDEDGFSPAWDVIREEWEALRKTAGVCDGRCQHA